MRERGDERGDDPRIELRTTGGAQRRQGLVERARRAVGRGRCASRPSASQAAMMRAPSGIVAAQPVGVAVAVPALVGVADERREALEPGVRRSIRSPTTGWSRTSVRSPAG